ncbi:MAG TPA: LacI family DNA-binding transcriptional regulator [Acidimicrobiales bacterium]|nr:LacI family DNA-binding transcriptional regulator [Acidimicrobiales bacterium]
MSADAVQRSPAMTDVARLAGVSHQTVSRVLNKHPYVSAATRGRVLSAIEELGYHPNAAARALATGRSHTIGLVTLDSTLYGPVATLYGIERAARSAGYYVSVVSLRAHDLTSLQDALRRLNEQAVAGVILIAPLPPAFDALAELPEQLPLVVVEGDPKAALPAVTVDQQAGARLATEHLLELGHRTVHHVAGPRDWTEARERIVGWRSALAAAKRPIPRIVRGDWSAKAGFDAARQLLDDGATAVFSANDTMALGLLRALHELGRRVPGSISIVGFDDLPECEYFIPPLTTVRQDFDDAGRHCMELFVAQAASGTRGATRIVIQPKLVVRASTARAGSAT